MLASVTLDVLDIARAAEFYRLLAGFEVVRRERQGLIHPEVHLMSPRYPGFGLVLREMFGVRVAGSRPGGMLRLAFYDPDPARRVPELTPHVRWVWEKQAPGPEGYPYLRMTDPDGYEIELYSERASTAT